MTTKKKINIFLTIYVVTLLILYGGVEYYIHQKSEKLYDQASQRFNDFFRDQKEFVDTKYANRTIKYVRTANPEKQPRSGYSLDVESWNNKHSDVYRYFRIDAINDGWRLHVAKRDLGVSIIFYEIYPSYVGYRTQEESYMYNWIPDVEECVEEAYEFWVSNTKSSLIDSYQKGSINQIYNLMRDVSNEYYHWNTAKHQLPPNLKGIGNMGYVENKYYRVFNDFENWKHYELIQDEDVIENEKKNKLILGGTILTLIFMSFLIPLFIQNKREEKNKREHEVERKREKNESIYGKLLRLCNPSNFMEPYDRDKIEKANSIYEQLMQTDSSDIRTLKILRKQATDELNISFINPDYLQDLKSQCNPQRYLEPYNPEKVRIANELYQKIIDNEEDMDLLEKIEREITETLL